MKHSLAQRIAEFIQRDGADTDAAFNALVCELFRYQHARNMPFRRLCDSYGVTPEHVTDWRDIPAVPAQAFKQFELSCVPVAQAVKVFHSSGTTGPETSRHYLDNDALALYEISLRSGFEKAHPSPSPCEGEGRGEVTSGRGGGPNLWALMPPPEEAPHSSLSHMLGTLGAEHYFWNDTKRLAAALREVRKPIILFGTAFAFVQLFDETNSAWRLPAGSVIIETGGFKGRTREVPRETLYAMLTARLGVPMNRCCSEYGMCEMASQFYGWGCDPIKRGPHWVRTRAIDPLTGDDATPGEAGLLRHYDLANFNSVSVLQTQDWGTLTENGFVLHGRASEAEVRGCSLTVEELWTTA